MTWEDVEAALRSGAGTLIRNSTSIGWVDIDVWWVSESARSVATSEGVALPETDPTGPTPQGFQARMLNPAFDRWCLNRFLGKENSAAKVVDSAHSPKASQRQDQRIAALQTEFSNLETMTIYECLVQLDDDMKKKRPAPAAPPETLD